MTGAPDIAGGAPTPRPADTPCVWHHPLNRLPWAPPDAGRNEMTGAQTVVIRPWEPGDDDALLAGFVDACNGPPWNDAWSLATAAAYLGELRGIPRSASLVAVARPRRAGLRLLPFAWLS